MMPASLRETLEPVAGAGGPRARPRARGLAAGPQAAKGSGVERLLQRLARMLAAALLALCIASPAVAEVGCSWDEAVHLPDAFEHEPDGDGDVGGAERDSHCAFGHGPASLGTAMAQPAVPPRMTIFVPPLAARHPSSIPPGLDRPPRA